MASPLPQPPNPLGIAAAPTFKPKQITHYSFDSGNMSCPHSSRTAEAYLASPLAGGAGKYRGVLIRGPNASVSSGGPIHLLLWAGTPNFHVRQ